MRPIWVDPSTTVLPIFLGTQAFIPLICLSASKQVGECLERRKNGFTYVQGSGDDHELWGRYAILRSHDISSMSQHRSRGLTPDLFWSHRSTLLATPRSVIESVIDGLMNLQAPRDNGLADSRWTSSLRPVHAVHGRLLSAAISELPNFPPLLPSTALETLPRRPAYVIITPHTPGAQPVEGGDTACQNILRMTLPAAVSAHSNFLLYDILPKAIDFTRKHLGDGMDVCVACPTGKDLGPGVIVAALSLFFSDNGDLVCGDADSKGEITRKDRKGSLLKVFSAPAIDKSMVRKRLQWIISSYPKVNPSRNTLKRVNEFLLSHLYHPHYAPPSSISRSVS